MMLNKQHKYIFSNNYWNILYEQNIFLTQYSRFRLCKDVLHTYAL